MNARSYDVNEEVGRILAGLDGEDRLACLDFLRQQLGVKVVREACTAKDVLLKKLAAEMRQKLERGWYINSVRVQDVERAVQDLQAKASAAVRDRTRLHYKLVDDIAAEDRFQRMLKGHAQKEHEARLDEEVEDLRRERRKRAGHAMGYWRERFDAYLKKMEGVYAGDGGYGDMIVLALATGDLEAAKLIFALVPQNIKDEYPMLRAMMLVAEIFLAKSAENDSTVTYHSLQDPYEMRGPRALCY